MNLEMSSERKMLLVTPAVTFRPSPVLVERNSRRVAVEVSVSVRNPRPSLLEASNDAET